MRMQHYLRRSAVSLAVILAIAAGILFAIDPFGGQEVMAQEETQSESALAEQAQELVLPAWMDIELEDALTGEVFRVRDFVGRPILLESFAVWCSICLRQQIVSRCSCAAALAPAVALQVGLEPAHHVPSGPSLELGDDPLLDGAGGVEVVACREGHGESFGVNGRRLGRQYPAGEGGGAIGVA